MQAPDHDPYRAPQARVADVMTPRALAGRGQRLGAKLIDALLSAVVTMPVFYFSGWFAEVVDLAMNRKPVPLALSLFSVGAGLAAHTLLQAYPLHRYGQTWGKRMLAIRIVDMEGNRPALARLIGLRFFSSQLIGLIPFVGKWAGLAGVLMIFRNDRRCLHDFIAGTRVINC